MEGEEYVFETFPFIFDLKGGSMGKIYKREDEFQTHLRNRIETEIPGATVLKNDPNWIQGFPDLTILYEDKWALLECKRGEDEPHQPNQDYYIDFFGNYVYSNFVFPENEERVLNELQQSLRS